MARTPEVLDEEMGHQFHVITEGANLVKYDARSIEFRNLRRLRQAYLAARKASREGMPLMKKPGGRSLLANRHWREDQTRAEYEKALKKFTANWGYNPWAREDEPQPFDPHGRIWP